MVPNVVSLSVSQRAPICLFKLCLNICSRLVCLPLVPNFPAIPSAASSCCHLFVPSPVAQLGSRGSRAEAIATLTGLLVDSSVSLALTAQPTMADVVNRFSAIDHISNIQVVFQQFVIMILVHF